MRAYEKKTGGCGTVGLYDTSVAVQYTPPPERPQIAPLPFACGAPQAKAPPTLSPMGDGFGQLPPQPSMSGLPPAPRGVNMDGLGMPCAARQRSNTYMHRSRRTFTWSPPKPVWLRRPGVNLGGLGSPSSVGGGAPAVSPARAKAAEARAKAAEARRRSVMMASAANAAEAAVSGAAANAASSAKCYGAGAAEAGASARAQVNAAAQMAMASIGAAAATHPEPARMHDAVHAHQSLATPHARPDDTGEDGDAAPAEYLTPNGGPAVMPQQPAQQRQDIRQSVVNLQGLGPPPPVQQLSPQPQPQKARQSVVNMNGLGPPPGVGPAPGAAPQQRQQTRQSVVNLQGLGPPPSVSLQQQPSPQQQLMQQTQFQQRQQQQQQQQQQMQMQMQQMQQQQMQQQQMQQQQMQQQMLGHAQSQEQMGLAQFQHLQNLQQLQALHKIQQQQALQKIQAMEQQQRMLSNIGAAGVPLAAHGFTPSQIQALAGGTAQSLSADMSHQLAAHQLVHANAKEQQLLMEGLRERK